MHDFYLLHSIQTFPDKLLRIIFAIERLIAVFLKISEQVLETKHCGIIIAAYFFLYDPNPF